jgi:hypothetical protein
MEMDQIGDLLAGRMPQEPPEIRAIKRYIDEHFHVVAQVAIQNETIIVSVKSASLANTLRLRLPQIREIAQTDRKLFFRIS